MVKAIAGLYVSDVGTSSLHDVGRYAIHDETLETTTIIGTVVPPPPMGSAEALSLWALPRCYLGEVNYPSNKSSCLI